MPDIASGSTAAVATLGMTTIMAMTPLGVSLGTLLLGGGCYFLGAASRTGIKLAKALEGPGTDPLNFQRQVAALLCMIPVAATASCMAFLGAKVLHVEADPALGGILFVGGLKGPEGLQWIADMVTDVFTRVMPKKDSKP